MAKNIIVQQSLVEQILNEMFTTLKEQDEFDTHTLQRLEELAKSGNLNKVKRVAESIKSVPERTA